MKLFLNNKVYSEFQFEKEAEFEREVVANSKLFFGAGSIYIDFFVVDVHKYLILRILYIYFFVVDVHKY